MFWFRIASGVFVSQWLLIRLLDVGLWISIENDLILPADERPGPVMRVAAVIIFTYDSFCTFGPPMLRVSYAYFQMNSHGFFQSDSELVAKGNFTRTGLRAPVTTELVAGNFLTLLHGQHLIILMFKF